MGHIGGKRMKKLHKYGFSESLGYESFDACEPCLLGLLEIIHTDVCDPMSMKARGKYRYFLTFTK